MERNLFLVIYSMIQTAPADSGCDYFTLHMFYVDISPSIWGNIFVQTRMQKHWNNHAGPVAGDNFYIFDASKYKRRTFWENLESWFSFGQNLQNKTIASVMAKAWDKCDLIVLAVKEVVAQFDVRVQGNESTGKHQ